MTEPAAIFTLIGNHLWQGALLAAVLAGALTFGRRLSAGQRHALAFATLAAVAALPLAALLPGGGLNRIAAEAQAASLSSARPALSFNAPAPPRPAAVTPAEPRAEAPRVTLTFSRSPTIAFEPAMPTTPTQPIAYDPPADAEAAPSRGGFPSLRALVPALATGLGLVWAIGATGFLIRVGADVCAAERLRVRAVPCTLPTALPAELRALPARESAEVQGPLVVGLLSPTIILPAGSLDRYADHELRALLEHERAHIERGDLMLALVQRILLSLLWWSPAMHWITRRIDDEREMACDEAAAAQLGDARAFAKALTAQAHAHIYGPRMAMGAAVGRSQLGRRVRRLIERAGSQAGSARFARAVSGMLAAVVITAAVATPRLEAQTRDAVPTAPAGPEAPALPEAAAAAEAAAIEARERRAQAAAQVAELEASLAEAQRRLQAEIAAAMRSGSDVDEARIDALGDEIGVLAEELARAMGAAATNAARANVENARRLAELGDIATDLQIAHRFEGVPGARASRTLVFGDNGSRVITAPGMNFRFFSLEDETPLAAAVRMGDADMVRVLLEAGADVNGDGNPAGSPLAIAMHAGDGEIVQLLIEAGANVDSASSVNGDTPLLSAIRSGDAEVAQQLIEAGADVDARGAGGETPLKLAVRLGDTDMVRTLVEAGADPNGGPDADD